MYLLRRRLTTGKNIGIPLHHVLDYHFALFQSKLHIRPKDCHESDEGAMRSNITASRNKNNKKELTEDVEDAFKRMYHEQGCKVRKDHFSMEKAVLWKDEALRRSKNPQCPTDRQTTTTERKEENVAKKTIWHLAVSKRQERKEKWSEKRFVLVRRVEDELSHYTRTMCVSDRMKFIS